MYLLYPLITDYYPKYKQLYMVALAYVKYIHNICRYSKNEILNSTTTFGGGIYSRTVKVYSFI